MKNKTKKLYIIIKINIQKNVIGGNYEKTISYFWVFY